MATPASPFVVLKFCFLLKESNSDTAALKMLLYEIFIVVLIPLQAQMIVAPLKIPVSGQTEKQKQEESR